MANLITVPMTTWTDELFLRAAGVTPAAVEQQLYNTLREFCKVSGAWVVELWDAAGDTTPQPFNGGADAAYYDFQALLETAKAAAGGGPYTTGNPASAFTQSHTIEDYWPWDILFIHRLSYFLEYTYDPNPSKATQTVTRFVYPSQTPNSRSPWGSINTVEGWPASFSSLNERLGAIQLRPTLLGNTADKEGIVPWVSLGFPRANVIDGIPIVFERMWYEEILDGTLGKLLSMQDKPWTNPVLAQYHGKRFRSGMATARDMAMRQFSNSERGWAFPAWA